MSEPAIDAELAAYLHKECNYIALRIMPDGHLYGICRYLFTFGICARVHWHGYDGNRWCYQEPHIALLAITLWDGQGDPPGPWIKRKGVMSGDAHNPLLFDHIKGSYWKPKPADQIDLAKLWPRGI